MEDLHLFVQELLREHNLSVAQLAQKADLAASSTYEYTGGRHPNTTWITLLRGLFALTEDIRIPELLTGEVPCMMIPIPKTIRDHCDLSTLKDLYEMQRKQLQRTEAMLAILADGKVDLHDREAMDQLNASHHESIKLEAQLYYTIRHFWDRVNK